MVESKGQGRGERRVIKGASVGAIASITVSVIANAVLAWLIVSEKMGEQIMGYGVLMVTAVSGAIGSYIAVRSADGKYMLAVLINGAIYLLLLLLLNIFFYGGEFHGILVTAGVVIAVCVATALLTSGIGKNTQKRGKRRKYR